MIKTDTYYFLLTW